MRNDKHCLLLSVFILFLAFPSLSQPDPVSYAITDLSRKGTNWIALRKLDTRTGEFSDMLINGANPQIPLYNAGSNLPFKSNISDTSRMFLPNLAFGSGVAAIAYDRKTNRLFFSQIYVDQLRYIDLSSMKVFCVNGKGFNGVAGSKIIPGNHLTRMVIAGDGYGYTISNDGNHLFRFSTTGIPVITDLGSLTDAPENNQYTILSSCANSGGDMVADDAGGLYLITPHNRVFQITIQTLQARHIGKISGLPEKFSTNGAAVDEKGRILLSSSLYGDAYYSVDPATWTAVPYISKLGVFQCADLANSNVIVTSKSGRNNNSSVYNLTKNSQIRLYPNPTENNQFMIRFSNLEAGEYTLQLTDILGRNVLQKKISIRTGSHTESIRFTTSESKGVYMVKVVNQNDQQVFIQKLWVEQLK